MLDVAGDAGAPPPPSAATALNEGVPSGTNPLCPFTSMGSSMKMKGAKTMLS